MKNLFINVFVLALGFSAVGAQASSLDRQIEDCRGDVTCTTKILANLIEGRGGRPDHPGSSQAFSLYHDDGRCEGQNLLAVIEVGTTDAECQRKAQFVRDRVWGIGFNGGCKDISDKDFVEVCRTVGAGIIPSFDANDVKLE
jgi:hypothetical protein